MYPAVPNDNRLISKIDGPWNVNIPQDVKMCAMDNVFGYSSKLEKDKQSEMGFFIVESLRIFIRIWWYAL